MAHSKNILQQTNIISIKTLRSIGNRYKIMMNAKQTTTAAKNDVRNALQSPMACLNMLNKWSRSNNTDGIDPTHLRECLRVLGVKQFTFAVVPTDRTGAICKYTRKSDRTVYYNTSIYTPAGEYVMQRVTRMTAVNMLDAIMSHAIMIEAGETALAHTLDAYDREQERARKREQRKQAAWADYNLQRISYYELTCRLRKIDEAA